MDWFYETLHPELRAGIRVDEEIYDGKTAFQSVRVFRNERLGRVLVLDDVVQTTEADEFFYHEMLTHPTMLAHGNVKNVLIIGGGDGGCMEEVLKHDVDKVVLAELDPDVIELSKQYLPSICGNAFDDPRAEVMIGDGAKFVAETDLRFDLIIVDSTDPIGPGEVLFQAPFYRGCHRALADGGVVITQNGVTFVQPEEVTGTYRAFREIFDHYGFYMACVPMYAGGSMAFGWGGKGRDLPATDRATIERAYAAHDLKTRYYNPDVHAAAFALPNYVRDLMT